MPKKKSSKAYGVAKEVFEASQEKPSTGSKKEESEAVKEKPCTSSKKGDEIEDIFASGKKKKKAEQEKAERIKNKNEKSKKIKKKKRSIPKESQVFNSDSKPRRRTNDGLSIYSKKS